jgi:hypothetical protein
MSEALSKQQHQLPVCNHGLLVLMQKQLLMPASLRSSSTN